MHIKICIFAFLLAICIHSKVVIQNLEDDFKPKDELDYINYLKLILGREDESTIVSQALIQLSSNKRYSLQNSVERVVIAFIPFASEKDEHISQSSKEIQLKGYLLQELIFETPQLFIITSLPANEEERLHQLINAYKKEGKVVHVIRGEAHEMTRLGKMMDMEEPKYQNHIHHPKNPTRRLAEVEVTQTTQTDSTYLIKFFFSIIFIIVLVAVIGFISSNDGKKDTLLYAKFIADVGSR